MGRVLSCAAGQPLIDHFKLGGDHLHLSRRSVGDLKLSRYHKVDRGFGEAEPASRKQHHLAVLPDNPLPGVVGLSTGTLGGGQRVPGGVALGTDATLAFLESALDASDDRGTCLQPIPKPVSTAGDRTNQQYQPAEDDADDCPKEGRLGDGRPAARDRKATRNTPMAPTTSAVVTSQR